MFGTCGGNPGNLESDNPKHEAPKGPEVGKKKAQGLALRILGRILTDFRAPCKYLNPKRR